MLDEHGSNSTKAQCFRLVEITYGPGLRGIVAKAIQKQGAARVLEEVHACIDGTGDYPDEIRGTLWTLTDPYDRY